MQQAEAQTGERAGTEFFESISVAERSLARLGARRGVAGVDAVVDVAGFRLRRG